MSIRKYLVLLCVMCFAPMGDFFLSRGMKQIGPIDLHHGQQVFFALANPSIIVGIALLIGFFVSYSDALSWADISYVLPATALGNVIMALLARFFLHEQISPLRWLGIILITCGVGWVTRGPERTEPLTVNAGLGVGKERHEHA
ncbi:MAG TPA: EamA family transporter [Candidatus Angelobacter sp.]|nr:EamA family transporter [Candidatus Angelobacter sp.]